jgi:hypothetical protein
VKDAFAKKIFGAGRDSAVGALASFFTHKSALCKRGSMSDSPHDRSAASPWIDGMCHSLHDAEQQTENSVGGNLEVRRIPRFKHASRLALGAGLMRTLEPSIVPLLEIDIAVSKAFAVPPVRKVPTEIKEGA